MALNGSTGGGHGRSVSSLVVPIGLAVALTVGVIVGLYNAGEVLLRAFPTRAEFESYQVLQAQQSRRLEELLLEQVTRLQRIETALDEERRRVRR